MSANLPRVDTTESLIRMISVLWLFFVVLLVFPLSPFTTGSFLILVIASFLLGPSVLKRRYDLIPLSERYPEIYSMVLRLCEARGLKKIPEQYFVDSKEPSPFVLGTTNNSANLVIPRGAIEALEPHELKAVVQHELSHIQNKDMGFMTWGVVFLKGLKYWVALCLFAVVAYDLAVSSTDSSGQLLGTMEWFLTGQLPIILIISVALPVLTICSVSRVREHLADARACLFLQNPSDLSSALSKITRWNVEKPKTPPHLSIINLGSSRKSQSYLSRYTIATHPSLKERLTSIETGKYVIKDNRLAFPDLEISFYAGLMVFYSVLCIFSVDLFFFLISVISVPHLILLVSLVSAVFADLYMIRYADPRVVEAVGYKEWALYMLRFIARGFITGGSLVAFGVLFTLLTGMDLISSSISNAMTIVLGVASLMFIILFFKDFFWRLGGKKARN